MKSYQQKCEIFEKAAEDHLPKKLLQQRPQTEALNRDPKQKP
jgi:hypothetical protein